MKYLKIFIILLVFLLNFQGVNTLAVTQPMPSNLTLERGDSIPFKFEIQAITSNEDQLCTYSISDLDPLKVSFEKEEALVKAGNVLSVLGTLKIPSYSPIKQYEGKLTVSCKPNIVISGVSLIIDTTEFPFLVKVKESEEKERLDLKYLTASIFFGIIIVILVWSKFKHKSKLKKKKRILKKRRKA